MAKVVQTPKTPAGSMAVAGNISGGSAYTQPIAPAVKERAPLDASRPAVQRSIDRMLVQVYGSPDAIPENDPLKDQYIDALTRRDYKGSYGIRDQIRSNLNAAEQQRQSVAAAAAAADARRAQIRGANSSTVANAFGFFNDDYFNSLYGQQANRQMGEIDSAARRMTRLLRDSGYYGSPLGDQLTNELAGLRASGMNAVEGARDGYITGERNRVRGEMDRLSNMDAEVSSVDAQRQANTLRNNPSELRVDNPFNDAQRQRWANALFNGQQVR